MSSEVEETLKRLVSHKGVIGTLIVNSEGVPIKSTLDSHTTTQYAGLLNQLVDQAKAMFKEIDSSNDLTFLRLRTKKHEIMVAPDKDYLLIVIQQEN
uniref:Dynein light chain roadblock n=1 Tax=Caligus clemensi TaxID=344056 RepID=C1C1Q5_CALCM|nr:dynein light chain roadblock-type 2-like [Lepeophtheirus salmonis]ACO15208.1 Dynein light chain roadblock-type 2 [Caligus clemensi]